MIIEKEPKISVVMGFRDWGLERLDLALEAHRRSTIADEMELVVVDYGSKDGAAVNEVAERWQARVCRIEARGRWNRSHCLNIGIREARSGRVVTTDADMLFAPRTLEVMAELADDARDFLLVQYRDLPPMSQTELSNLNFESFAQSAEIRPPWGMGCACFRRDLAFEIRGFDERMEWWGAEDNDFVQRAVEFKENVRWLDHEDARIYHMWHPKLTDLHAKDERFKEAVKQNRHLMANDITVIRNAYPWGAAVASRPAISACIITRNRAHLIGQTIDSLLNQSRQDFEIVIVDDGSEDRTNEVVKEYHDPRIKYIRRPYSGIPAARNVAVAEASGDYVCIVDDDDIQLPDRIERHLCAVEDGYVGSYGGWIDFDEETREVFYNPGRPYSLEAILFTGKVLTHAASCILREVLREHKYREDALYGSDYDLALRIAASGYRFKHVGSYLILRRLHAHGVTSQFSPSQKRTGEVSAQKVKAVLTSEEVDRARKIASLSTPLDLANPFQDTSLFSRIPPSLARVFAKEARGQVKWEATNAGMGQVRVLEREQCTPARLEVGPFGSIRQCEVHLGRLRASTDQALEIDARQQGKSDVVYFITWPWTLNGEAWAEQNRVERTYRYPNCVVLKEMASPNALPTANEEPLHFKPRGGHDRMPPGSHLTTLSNTEIAERIFPVGANVLVISKGDERLLDLGSAYGSHFPQSDDGKYSGFHPVDSAAAIAHLEALRSKGAEYLFIPASSFWWLEHYEEFRRHLEQNCRLIHYQDGLCIIYDLNQKMPTAATGLKKRLWIPVDANGSAKAGIGITAP